MRRKRHGSQVLLGMACSRRIVVMMGSRGIFWILTNRDTVVLIVVVLAVIILFSSGAAWAELFLVSLAGALLSTGFTELVWSAARSVVLHGNMSVEVVERTICLCAVFKVAVVVALNFVVSAARPFLLLGAW